MIQTQSLIISPDGTAANYPTEVLTPAEAQLLREYKLFLNKRGYKEALYCNSCFERNLSHGCDARVTPNQIVIKCRCRLTFYEGPTL